MIKSILTVLSLLVEVLGWVRQTIAEKRSEGVSKALKELRNADTKSKRRAALKSLVDSSD